jgi:hypothetical protein
MACEEGRVGFVGEVVTVAESKVDVPSFNDDTVVAVQSVGFVFGHVLREP